MTKHRVLFVPSQKEVSVEPGTTLLDAARLCGVHIDSQCGGVMRCGKCRVRLVEGSLDGPAPEESALLGPTDTARGFRLACAAHVAGDAAVLIENEDVLSPVRAKKTFTRRAEKIDPCVAAYVVELSQAPSAGPALLEKITYLLANRYGLSNTITVGLDVLRRMPQAADEGNGVLTVIIRMEKEIIDVRPGRDETCLGLALDVGTTTLALYVCGLKDGAVIASASITNPQVVYGADIISRVTYSVRHPAEGVGRMQRDLILSVNAALEHMAQANGFSLRQIVDTTVVGNTVMHHIFLGVPPDSLGASPFTPAIDRSVDVRASDIAIAVNPSSYVHVLPVEAGFVGPDNVAVLLSEEPFMRDDISLVIDLGTNGEAAVGNRQRLFSCSCATGPALEGSHITDGMRATAGAIDTVRIDPAAFDVAYTVVGRDANGQNDVKPIGICGSGIIDAVAGLLRAGLIGKDGAFSGRRKAARLRKNRSGVMEFVIAWADETATGREIVLSQKDIRQIQLAKGALYAGCSILMQRMGVTSVDRIVIAGAFGVHIDKESALTLGLFPHIRPDDIIMAGNAAGHGAYLALVDRTKRMEADIVARSVTHVELAGERSFQREFMNALGFPAIKKEKKKN
jgi:uncharacterized 2Fe-2S/4Fe-4S cluster protein (DUF4445 family)